MQTRLVLSLLLLTVELVSAQTVGQNVMAGLAGAEDFFVYLYYVVGIGFVFSGINKLKKLGHRTAFMNVDAGITGPMMLVIIGGCLTALPAFLQSINQTIFANASIKVANELSYRGPGRETLVEQIKPVIFIIQLIGMIALLRGFLILSKATGQGAQPGTISKGFIHILGGVLAVNVVETANVFTKTFGVS